MEFKKVEKIILNDGWYLWKHDSSSHRHYKHPIKKGKVTIAFHGNKCDIDIATFKSIMKQAGLK